MIRYITPAGSCLFFVLIALAFLPMAGIQMDEALFSAMIYGEGSRAMLMSYLGTVKSWVYTPIFKIWAPSVYSVRVPAVLLGGLTIVLFWALLLRVSDKNGAVFGAVLLSTDTLFLITTVFDWGPVVLQRLLLVAGILCLVRFHQDSDRRYLALGFLLFGVQMWDKALAGWVLSGLALATLAVFPRELWKHLRIHNLAIAAGAFCLGAWPLIDFNIQSGLETFRSNVGYSTTDVPGKVSIMRQTFSGRGLFDYIPRPDHEGPPMPPRSAVQKASHWISEKTGARGSGYFEYALAGSAILLPWLLFTPAGRPAAFALIAMGAAWGQMLVAANAGGSVHHTMLIWPLPTLLVAVALAQGASGLGRAGPVIGGAAVLFLASTNFLVTNEYYAKLSRNGTGLAWTDAIHPLSDYLSEVKQARAVFVVDWGIFDTVRMLHKGQIPLRVASDHLGKSNLDAEQKKEILSQVAEPGALFVDHVEEIEFFPGKGKSLREVAAEAGYTRRLLARIPDRNGRPIFEVFDFSGPR